MIQKFKGNVLLKFAFCVLLLDLIFKSNIYSINLLIVI